MTTTISTRKGGVPCHDGDACSRWFCTFVHSPDRAPPAIPRCHHGARCSKGAACKFSHPGQPTKFGHTIHDIPERDADVAHGLRRRRDSTSSSDSDAAAGSAMDCHIGGRCKNGAACKFRHFDIHTQGVPRAPRMCIRCSFLWHCDTFLLWLAPQRDTDPLHSRLPLRSFIYYYINIIIAKV